VKKKNIKVLSCLIVSIILLSINHNVNASWAYLSADDLIEQSDCIFIGEILRSRGYTNHEFPNTIWEVEVEYPLLSGFVMIRMLNLDGPEF